MSRGERALLDRIRAYASDRAHHPPNVFRYFAGGEREIFPLSVESDRGTALLLMFCALRQNITEERLAASLGFLWREYGSGIFRLNRSPFAELQARVRGSGLPRDWPLRDKAPGILRSACDFFFRHGRIMPWVMEVGDGEECVRILAEEIFLMGKTSDLRPKPRHFLWLLTCLPGAQPEKFWGGALLCPTPGHGRFLRDIGPLRAKRGIPWKTPEEKLAWCNRYYRQLFPEGSHAAFAGLDAYLKPEPGEWKWACRKSLGGCENCALVEYCPGREI